jgi:hypothetical protein
MPAMSRSLAACVLLMLGMTAGSASALSEAIPPENIRAQHESCVEGCVRAGIPSDYCETGCTCYDRQVAENFSWEEFQILDKAVRDNPSSPNFPPALKTKLDNAMQACR